MPLHAFGPIKNAKLSENIVAQIKKSILDGTYKPGDKLPSERELLDMFAVSRSSLREALRVLEEMGLIIIKRGPLGGAYVTRRGISSLASTVADVVRMAEIDFEELSEMRLIIEPHMARLAAQNCTESDIEELEKQNHLREKAIDEGKIPIVVTINFHQAVARAAKNKMLRLVVDAIASILLDEFKKISLSLEDHRAILGFHKHLTESIRNHDAESAFRIMQEHITDVTKRLKG